MCNAVKKPMEPSVNILQNTGKQTEKPFRSLIGALSYLVQGTRPDIAYPVNELARQQANLSKVHWELPRKYYNI